MCWKCSDKIKCRLLEHLTVAFSNIIVQPFQSKAGPCTGFCESKNAPVPPSVATAHLGLQYRIQAVFQSVQGKSSLTNLTLQEECAAGEEEQLKP